MLEKDVEHLGQEKQEREVALAAVATKIESLKVEERRLRLLLAETDEASRRHQEAQANLEASVAALAAVRSDGDRLAAEIAAGRVRAEELRRMNAEREKARQETESDLARLNQEVESAQRAIRELEGRRKGIGSEIADLTRKLQETSQANDGAREQTAALRERQAALSARHRTLEEDIQKASERLRELRTEADAAEQRRADLGQVMTELAEETAQLQRLSQKAGREREKALEEVDRAREETAAARKARDHAEIVRAHAAEQHLEFVQKIKQLSEERSDLEAAVSALRVDTRLQEARLNVLRGRESDLAVSIAEKESQLRRLKAETEVAARAHQIPREGGTVDDHRPDSVNVTNGLHPMDGDRTVRSTAPLSQKTPGQTGVSEENSASAASLEGRGKNSTQPSDGVGGGSPRKDELENEQ